MNHIDDEPGSGEKRERSEGRENRGGQAGQGKHERSEPESGEGGGQRPAEQKRAGEPKPQRGDRPARSGDG
jgi:hypothetical protein